MNNVIKKPLVLLYFLNLLDLAFTFVGLRLLLIEEANPLMAYLYVVSPWLLIIAKVVIVLLGVKLISLIYDKRWVKYATLGLNGVYLGILFLHLNNFFNVYVPHIVGML